jgi:hypothetical protein
MEPEVSLPYSQNPIILDIDGSVEFSPRPRTGL